jgi:hypothetical protein
MRCSKCSVRCSDEGHLQGKETRRGGGEIVYACVRCDIDLVQKVCEGCEGEIGALEPRMRPAPPAPPKPKPEPVAPPAPKPAAKPATKKAEAKKR